MEVGMKIFAKLVLMFSLLLSIPSLSMAEFQLDLEQDFELEYSNPFDYDLEMDITTAADLVPKTNDLSLTHLKDFMMVSIPKTGTHLLAKLLVMLSGRYPRYMRSVSSVNEILAELEKGRKSNYYLYHHTGSFLGRTSNEPLDMGSILTNAQSQIVKHVKIIQIRDLRDVFVSLVHYLDKRSPGAWTRNGGTGSSTFGDKLTIALKTMIESDIKNALVWINHPDVVVVRFEEIIGAKGGGSLQSQSQAISTLSNALGIQLSGDRLQAITDNLFGITSGPKVATTFFKGQIGSWKEAFGPEHIKLFNERWGTYQQALGYPLAE